MERKKLRPIKALGQHFLYNPAIAGRIVSKAGLSQSDVVVELGAGKGILTRALLETGARVIALEIDKALAHELAVFLQAAYPGRIPGGSEGEAQVSLDEKSKEEPLKDRFEIINGDFTKLSLTGLVASRGFERCILMGNIPYNLTRHVLFFFLVDEVEVIDRAYLMVQREVGERIVAKAGSRTYGITSVILQSLYEVSVSLRVSAGSFHPRPKVNSEVLEFLPRKTPLVGPEEIKPFKQFVRNLFQQRRKTTHNLLKIFYMLPDRRLKELQAATAIDLNKRPEALSKEELLRLFERLNVTAKDQV